MDPSPAFFRARRIATHCVPAHVLAKAQHIICLLEWGTPYWRLHGKRLQRNRAVISIPVGRRYRLLAVESQGKVHPRELLSHAQYNHRQHHL